MADYWDEYAWIVVVGVFLAFVMAYGIGANDVANAFATSVGSRALKLWHAVILAGIAEFAGALLLGRGVSSTIRSGILDLSAFEDIPAVLMYANLCALAAASTWLIVATTFELPVSTTHSIIGGLVGAGLASVGSSAVNWYEETDEGIHIDGIVAIVLSWIISPVASGVVAALVFWIARTFVLRSENSFTRTFVFFPVLVFFAVWINLFYVLDKGVTKQVDLEWWESLYISAATALGVALLVAAAMPKLKNYLHAQAEKAAVITQQGVMLSKEEAMKDGLSTGDVEANRKVADETAAAAAKDADASEKATSSFFDRANNFAREGVFHDVHQVIQEDKDVHALHSNAEQFDPRAESAFRYLQIFTAFCDSFAHGANDVANSIGPFTAIWDIYRHAAVSKKSEIPTWILVVGGFGIVCGLATYGYKIIRAIGVKLVSVTPSRGFSIEMGSAIVVITGSRLELPLSTTHCQVGATVAVGMLEAGSLRGGGGVNWKLTAKICLGWIFTLIIAGLLSAALMAIGVYSPNLNQSEAINNFADAFNTTQLAMVDHLACAQPATFATNLNDTAAYVMGVAGDVQRHPNRIADALTYTQDLTISATAVTCPANQFEALSPELVTEYAS